jgi:D-alanyl-D-alanine carboxypeptidase
MVSERHLITRGRLLTATLVLLSLPMPARAQTAPPGATRVRAVVDSLARAFLADSQAPGVSIAVVRGGDTIVSTGWGFANLEEGVPATAATLYRIGSITKQFTSAAVMRLVQAAKVSLDDSIGVYLPDLPAAWRGVTVRELLNHTSGIPSYTDIGERWQRRWREDMPTDSLVAMTASDSMWFAPGTKWRYDNTGYVVLGMLLDHVTGQPYSAGALCSTVGDLARWNLLLAGGQVVDSASYHAMTTPTGAARAHHYGFGLGADTLDGHAIIKHGGGIPGFITSNSYLPDDRLSVTVLTNAGTSSPDPLADQVARAALGIPLLQPPKRVALTAAQRKPYVGDYEMTLPNDHTMQITITDDGNALQAQAHGQDAFELIPFGHDVFGARFDPTLRITFTLADGRATGFALVQGGATIHARRVNGGS